MGSKQGLNRKAGTKLFSDSKVGEKTCLKSESTHLKAAVVRYRTLSVRATARAFAASSPRCLPVRVLFPYAALQVGVAVRPRLVSKIFTTVSVTSNLSTHV